MSPMNAMQGMLGNTSMSVNKGLVGDAKSPPVGVKKDKSHLQVNATADRARQTGASMQISPMHGQQAGSSFFLTATDIQEKPSMPAKLPS